MHIRQRVMRAHTKPDNVVATVYVDIIDHYRKRDLFFFHS